MSNTDNIATNLASLYGETVYHTNKTYNLHLKSAKMKSELANKERRSRSQLEVAHRMVKIKEVLADGISDLMTEAEVRLINENEKEREHRIRLRKKEIYQSRY